jgi:hypothetical protein
VSDETTTCMATGCTVTEDLVSWERIARPEELPDDLPPLAPGDVVKLLVVACSDIQNGQEQGHAIPAELRPLLHQAACTAPPACTCTPSAP